MTKLLLVEDDDAIREMLGFAFEREDYELAEATDVAAAKLQLAEQRPDLAIVDWMLPDQSGIELIRYMRSDEVMRDIPIIMLTARSEEYDKVAGLDAGADDYMTKPVAIRELLARINAQLRRVNKHQDGETLQMGPVVMDIAAHIVTVNDKPVEMGATEFKLLRFFMSHPGRVYSRSRLLDHVWGQNVYVEERTVDVHILRLRKALKPVGADKLVQTVRGAGYRFSDKLAA